MKYRQAVDYVWGVIMTEKKRLTTCPKCGYIAEFNNYCGVYICTNSNCTWESDRQVEYSIADHALMMFDRLSKDEQLKILSECGVDVRPNIHAHWISEGTGYGWHYRCSNCNYIDGDVFKDSTFTFNEDCFNYCPNCGAIMDEEDNNETN